MIITRWQTLASIKPCCERSRLYSGCDPRPEIDTVSKKSYIEENDGKAATPRALWFVTTVTGVIFSPIERKSVHCGTGHNLVVTSHPPTSRKELKAKRRNLLRELDFEEGVGDFGNLQY